MITRQAHRIFAGFIVGTLVFLYLIPTIYSILLSLDLLTVPPVEGAPNIRSYQEIFSDERLVNSISRSFCVSSVVSLIAVAVCLFTFSDFHRYRLWTKKFLLGLVMLPLFVPETTHALTLSDALSRNRLFSDWSLIVLAEVSYITPFIAIIILLRVANISPNIDNAARDLGMRPLKRALSITLPLVWLTTVSALIFGFLLTFNENTRTSYFQAREMYSSYLRGNLSGGGGQAVYAVSAAMFAAGVVALCIIERSSRRREQDE